MQASTFERPQLFDRRCRFAAQLQQTLGIFAQQDAGRRERAVTRGALEKRIANFFFETANGVAHRRLGAVQARSGARETALLYNRKKGFELRQVHKDAESLVPEQLWLI